MLAHLHLSRFPKGLFVLTLMEGESVIATPFGSERKVFAHTQGNEEAIFGLEKK